MKVLWLPLGARMSRGSPESPRGHSWKPRPRTSGKGAEEDTVQELRYGEAVFPKQGCPSAGSWQG